MLPFMILLGVVSAILQLIPVAGMVAYGAIALFIVPYLAIKNSTLKGGVCCLSSSLDSRAEFLVLKVGSESA